MKQESARDIIGQKMQFPTAMNPVHWPRLWREDPLRAARIFLVIPIGVVVISLLPDKVAIGVLIGFAVLIFGCLIAARARRIRGCRHRM